MTNQIKSQLLIATALFGLSATAAQAQVAYPAAELHAMGASSIAVILPTEMNCFGGNYANLGKNDGSATTKLNTATSNGLTCAGYDATPALVTTFSAVQDQISGKYVSTGSGGGRTAWKNIDASTFFTGSTGAIFPSAFGTTWANPHFVMTDAPISSAEKTTFAAASSTKKAGAAIQFPLYVLPVAIAYNTVYGHKVTENVDLSFNVQNTISVNGTTVPALRLSKQVYCGIFNGYIQNWNDAKITALNVGPAKGAVAKSLMDTVNDTTARWNADGVPIRLVGRLDKSGTTDIFSRHLSTACNGGIMGGSNPNKFLNAAETLPFDSTSAIDLRSFRSDTNYKPGTAAGSLAGTSQLISGAVFTGSAIDTTVGAEAAGKYMVADGSSKVAGAINFAPDKASASDANVLLNGKIGYVGADWVKPSAGLATGTGATAAVVEVGNTAATKKPLWVYPTAADAITAFGTKILPPESNAKGAYVAGGSFSRANPLDWTDALYAGGSTLANPAVGYPITGTTEFVSGTCFASAAERNALVTFLQTILGNVKTGVKGGKAVSIKPDAFVGVAKGKFGFKAQLGIAPLPLAWRTAVINTFLSKAAKEPAAAALNLWIQDALPTGKSATKTVNGKTVKLAKGDLMTAAQVAAEVNGNPSCTVGSGL